MKKRYHRKGSTVPSVLVLSEWAHLKQQISNHGTNHWHISLYQSPAGLITRKSCWDGLHPVQYFRTRGTSPGLWRGSLILVAEWIATLGILHPLPVVLIA